MAYIGSEGELKVIVYVGMVRDGELLLVDYRTPPNPNKQGWWIPAPEVRFGEAPEDEAVEWVSRFGFQLHGMNLHEVQSFVVGPAWHLAFIYRADVSGEPAESDLVNRYAWAAAEQLPAASEFAHGGWERRLALALLGAAE